MRNHDYESAGVRHIGEPDETTQVVGKGVLGSDAVVLRANLAQDVVRE